MKILKSNKWIINFGLCVAAAGLLVSCDDYLDENPDNRAVIDTEEEIISLLGSAYPEAGISVMSELMSDNTDDMSGDPRFLKYDERFYDQVFYWKEVTETDNDGPSITWENGYKAAAKKNELEIKDGSKGCIFNADAVDLIKLIDFGSSKGQGDN